MSNNLINWSLDFNTLLKKYVTKSNLIKLSIVFGTILLFIGYDLWQKNENEKQQIQLSQLYDQVSESYNNAQFDEADEIVQKMKNINPNSYFYVFAKLNQAKNYTQQKNKFQDAIDIYNEVLAIELKKEMIIYVQFQLAKTYYDKGDYADAFDVASDAEIQAEHFRIALLNLLGDISLAQKNLQQAISYYQEAKENNEIENNFISQYIDLKLQNLNYLN